MGGAFCGWGILWVGHFVGGAFCGWDRVQQYSLVLQQNPSCSKKLKHKALPYVVCLGCGHM